LSTERWDLFIQFDPLFSWDRVIPAALIGKFSKAKWRLGVNTERRGIFLTHRVQCDRKRLVHFTRKYLELAELVGGYSSNFKTHFYLDPQDETFAGEWFEKNKIKEEDFLVAVQVTGEADSLARTSWPRDHFRELLKQLGERYALRYLFFSSEDVREKNWVHSITDRLSPAPLTVGGDLPLGIRAAILKRAKLVIANDSDLLHLAAALGLPVMGIFGPGDVESYATYGEEADLNAFYRQIDCRPCVNKACEKPLCLKGVPLETVLEAAAQKIQSLTGICRIASSQSSCPLSP
jgi:ADP-heptose:LPS heptosyltransferase